MLPSLQKKHTKHFSNNRLQSSQTLTAPHSLRCLSGRAEPMGRQQAALPAGRPSLNWPLPGRTCQAKPIPPLSPLQFHNRAPEF